MQQILFNMFPDIGWDFGGIKTSVGENDGSDVVDRRLRRSRPHTAKIDKVTESHTDLALIFSVTFFYSVETNKHRLIFHFFHHRIATSF